MSDEFVQLNGTIRYCHSKETISRLKPLLSRVGISRVSEVTKLDRVGLPVFFAIRPLGKHASTSQGKGTSKDLAWISAVMEAIEAFHIENAAPSSYQGSYHSLSNTHNIADPNDFASNLLTCNHLHKEHMGWSSAKDLLADESILVPHTITSLDSTAPHIEQLFFSISTNGLAAGNTHKEALCHALFEVNERDDLVKWSRLSTKIQDRPSICPNNVDHENKETIKAICNAGLDVKIWNISSSSLYSFRCAIFEKDKLRKIKIAYGTGCHFFPEIALSRALTEAVQDRLVYISGNRDDLMPDYYKKQKASQVEGFSTYANHQDMPKSFSSFKNFREMFNELKEILVCDKKIQKMYMFDHTRDDIGIPAVQIFTPELEYSFRRI